MMQHYYKDVPSGWFNYEAVYKRAIENASYTEPSKFVELGVWFGQSMCFAGVEIINSGKPITLDGVDWFLQGDQPAADAPFDEIRYSEAIRYTSPVNKAVNVIKLDSVSAANLYGDNTLDFVYIDANHTYDGVMHDIKHWYPKVKSGGIIAGHDYQDHPWSGLIRAVDEFFGKDNIEIDTHSWSWLHTKGKV